MEQLKDLQRAIREAEGKWLRREPLEQPEREFLRVGFLQILEDAGLSLIAQELAFAVFDRRLKDPKERSGEGLAADRKDCRAAAAAANLQTSDPFEALRRGIQLRQAHVGELAAYAGTRFPKLSIRSPNLKDEIIERANARWHQLLMGRRDRPGPHDPVGKLDGLLQVILTRSEADVVGDPNRLQSADDEFSPIVATSSTDDATDFSDAKARLLALQRSAIARIAPNLTFKGQYRRTLKPLFEDAAGDQPSPMGRKLLCLLVRVQKDELPEQLAGGQRYEELLEDVRAHVFSSLSKARKRGSFEKQIQRLREKVLAAIRQSPESRAARVLFPSGLLAPTLFDSLSGWLKRQPPPRSMAPGASDGPPTISLLPARTLRWGATAAAATALLLWGQCGPDARPPSAEGLKQGEDPAAKVRFPEPGGSGADGQRPSAIAAGTTEGAPLPGGSSPASAPNCPDGMAAIEGGRVALKQGVVTNAHGDLRQVEYDVAPFCLDLTEVTVGEYGRCVAVGACPAPLKHLVPGRCTFWRAPSGMHPVNCVTNEHATLFCRWAGKRVPLHAEWTWAAQGAARDTRYPWGNSPPTAARLNGCGAECRSPSVRRLYVEDDGWKETAPVGSYPEGRSPQGVFDLAGNLDEITEGAGELAPVVGAGNYLSTDEEDVRAPGKKIHAGDKSTGGSVLEYLVGFRCAAEPGRRLPQAREAAEPLPPARQPADAEPPARDTTAANAVLQAECENQSTKACVDLAAAYLAQGELGKAEPLLRKACSARDADGCNNLGGVLISRKDFTGAEEALREACAAGLSVGCTNLGSLLFVYGKSKQREGYELLKKQCERGEANACQHLDSQNFVAFDERGNRIR